MLRLCLDKTSKYPPLEIKVPKHILDQIKHEARDLSIPLDNHVAAILKKYLLEGILGP